LVFDILNFVLRKTLFPIRKIGQRKNEAKNQVLIADQPLKPGKQAVHSRYKGDKSPVIRRRLTALFLAWPGEIKYSPKTRPKM
jgi:hypothetical protein